MSDQVVSQPPMIEIHGLVKAYGVLPVLRKLDLCVAKGEFLALLGPNGGGKSTLLRLLCGLTPPNEGQLLIGGWQLPREAHAVRAQIGLVSHEPLLYDTLTARENLEFFGDLYGLSRAETSERSAALLKRVGLAKRARDQVRTFSRGMQQRLSIARAMLHNPHILLLDEPYTGLDQDASEMLDELLRGAHHDGHTIVMVSHQLDRAASLSSRIVILSHGVIGFDCRERLETIELAEHYSRVTGKVSAQ